MKDNFFQKNKHAIITYAITLFLLLAIITAILPHFEGDEIIYQSLGIKLASFQSYNLHNTEVLKYLPREIYNTSLFFRPPAFMVYLAILYILMGNIGLHLSPVIIFILLCIVVYKTTLIITKSQNSALKAFLLSSVSSLLLFSSLQIHLDLFMTLMVALSFYCIILFRESNKNKYVFLSGLFLGLAVLTKYSSVILYPFYLLFLLYKSPKNKLFYCLLFLFPSLIVVIWLFNVIFVNHMTISSLFSSPNHDELIKFPFINYVYRRPFYFYFLDIFIINPLYFFIFLLFRKKIWSRLRSRYGYFIYFLLSIILTIFIAFTIFGISGGTYQMRFILIAEPFLIILLSLIPFEEFTILWNLFWVFAIYNFLLVLYNVIHNNPELYSFFDKILFQR